ncbi:MAG: Arc family DNA-binding protein [Burkholderiaceae bacterium]|nr:Arc family DNA-binding protein [Burkholderiaceae bacterium]
MIKPPIQKQAQQDYIKTALRIPRDLHADILDAAERNGRSMNAEIIARLQAEPVNDLLTQLARDVIEIKALDREILDVVSSR